MTDEKRPWANPRLVPDGDDRALAAAVIAATLFAETGPCLSDSAAAAHLRACYGAALAAHRPGMSRADWLEATRVLIGGRADG